jgi:hypothetical protein
MKSESPDEVHRSWRLLRAGAGVRSRRGGYNVPVRYRIDVPTELEDETRTGVLNCPEAAVIILETARLAAEPTLR